MTNKDKDVPEIVEKYVKTPSDLDSVLRQRSNSRLPQFSDLFGFALLRYFPQLTVRDGMSHSVFPHVGTNGFHWTRTANRFYGTDLSWGPTELKVHVRNERQKAIAAAAAASNGADDVFDGDTFLQV